MVTVKKEGIILLKTELFFENEGVLNPATLKEGDDVHLFYRAIHDGNYSSIGYCKLNGALTVANRFDKPVIVSECDYESHGIEDPRIVKIDDLYYLTYTAFDSVNALGAWAISKDLLHWEKKGLIVPKVTYDKFNSHAKTKKKLNEKYFRFNHHEGLLQKKGREVLVWDKDVILFPRKIEDHFVFLHRIKPDIQIVTGVQNLEDLTPEFWLNYLNDFHDHILMKPKYDHEASYIGGGCPPIETQLGWLIIYHGVQDTVKGYVYSVCAALLDLNDPKIEMARLPYPLFKPEFKWELKGRVDNICFPTGTALFGDTLYIYYGAADEQIACASVSLSALLKELMLNIPQDEK